MMRKPLIPDSHGGCQERRGVVAPLVAISLVALLGVCALVLDVGFMQDRKRHLQSATDAAALAAATDMFVNDPKFQGLDVNGTAKASATYIANVNGYTDDGSTTLVTVNIPPKNGLFISQPGYAEVIIQYAEPRRFSAIFGTGNLPILARAVARGGYRTVGDGILILDLHQQASLKVGGTGSSGPYRINVNGAPIIVNSDDPSAGFSAGGAKLFDGKGYDVTGNVNNSLAFQGGPVNINTPPVPDPFRLVPQPDPSTLPTGTDTVTNLGGGAKLHTLTPGVFSGGLSFSGQDAVTMQPGIYYMQGGGFSMTGQGAMNATNVLIYNDGGGNVKIAGQGAVNWTPYNGAAFQGADGKSYGGFPLYFGFSMWQDRASTTAINVVGNGQFSIAGMFYAANAAVKIAGNGDASIGSQYISRTLDAQGNGDYAVTYAPTTGPKVRIIQLVE